MTELIGDICSEDSLWLNQQLKVTMGTKKKSRFIFVPHMLIVVVISYL